MHGVRFYPIYIIIIIFLSISCLNNEGLPENKETNK